VRMLSAIDGPRGGAYGGRRTDSYTILTGWLRLRSILEMESDTESERMKRTICWLRSSPYLTVLPLYVMAESEYGSEIE